MRGKIFAAVAALIVGVVLAATAMAKPFTGEIVECPWPLEYEKCHAFVVQSQADVPWRIYKRMERQYNPSGIKPDEAWHVFEKAVKLRNIGLDMTQLRPDDVVYLPLTVGEFLENRRRDVGEDQLWVENNKIAQRDAELYVQNVELRESLDKVATDFQLLRTAFWALLLLVVAILFAAYLWHLMRRWTEARSKDASVAEPTGGAVVAITAHRR